jgi:hypothetical protein
MTGSSLAATFGRGRHRGGVHVTADRLRFVDLKGSVVYDEALTAITDISLTKLGVLHVTTNTKVRLFVDGSETNEVSASTLQDAIRAIQSITSMKGLHHNLTLAWQKARSSE